MPVQASETDGWVDVKWSNRLNQLSDCAAYICNNLRRKSAVKWSTPLATAEPLGVSRFLFSCTTSETSWSRSGTKQVSVNIENKLNRNSCDKYAKKTKKRTQPNTRAGMKRAIDFCTREPREEPFPSCQKFYSILNFFNFESRPHASNTSL